LRASNTPSSSSFGATVAIDGDLIAVGAPRAPGSPSSPANDGAVYLYRKNAQGQWPSFETGRCYVDHGVTGLLGQAIALDRGTLLAGSGGTANWAAIHAFAVGAEEDICVPPATANVDAHLDVQGDTVAGSGDQNVLLSRCTPSSRYLVLASLMGDPNGCGPSLGGMPLCLCGSLYRVGFGQLGPTDTVRFVDLPTMHPLAQRLFAQVGSVYLQAHVAAPGGPQFAGLTNAVRLDVH
jgi:hypothetical protein